MTRLSCRMEDGIAVDSVGSEEPLDTMNFCRQKPLPGKSEWRDFHLDDGYIIRAGYQMLEV